MPALPGDASAAYVFRVEFRLSAQAGVSVEPDTFEATLYRDADPPGEDGWLFFRDVLWRGEANDERHLRALASDALGVGVSVTAVRFSELRTNPAYLDALRDEIAAELRGADEPSAAASPFGNAETVEAVLKHYLGSSIHVVE